MKAIPLIAAKFTQEEIMLGHAADIFNALAEQDLARIQLLIDADFMPAAHRVADEILDEIREALSHDLHVKSHFILSRPAASVGMFFHKKLGIRPSVGKFGVAWSIVFTGAYMATHPIHALPHFIWDGIAYTIHGLGAAPIAESVLHRLAKKRKP